MPRPLLICTADSSDALRRLARHAVDRRAAMRILAIAAASDGARTGRPGKLGEGRRRVLCDLVLAGPDVEKAGRSASARDAAAKIVKAKWNIDDAATTIGRIIKEGGLDQAAGCVPCCVQVTKTGIDASIGWQWRWRTAAAEGQQ